MPFLYDTTFLPELSTIKKQNRHLAAWEALLRHRGDATIHDLLVPLAVTGTATDPGFACQTHLEKSKESSHLMRYSVSPTGHIKYLKQS